MNRRGIFLFLSIVLLSKIASAQYTEIFGRVTDVSTKEAMPYVNISFKGSLIGTTTDLNGAYTIHTTEKVDSISFSFVGYRTYTIAVKRGRSQQMNVALSSEDLKVAEIVVKAGPHKHKREIDTTANYVYYQILKHKDENRSENINSYKYDNYQKILVSLLNPSQKLVKLGILHPFSFVFNNKDTTEAGNIFIPALLKETLSEVYYRKHPKAIREITRADEMTGVKNPTVSKFIGQQFEETNIYDNLFVIAYNSFPSPFSPDGIRTYFYYVTDTMKIDGRVSYKFSFVGKVKEDLAVKGYAWIDSATWAIKKVTFRPNQKANINFLNDHTVTQEYSYINNKYWILSRETINAVAALFKKSNKTSILITKILDRKNIQTDIAFPDSIFKGSEQQIILDSARNMPRAYWDSTRFEPLTRQEKEVFHISDTLHEVPAWKAYEWAGRFLTAAYADAGPISIGRILNFVSKNNVEGWRLRFGFETTARFQHEGTPANDFLRKFYFTGYVAYGLGDKVWQYMALSRFSLPHKNDRWQALQVMYRYDMVVPGQNEDQTLLTFDNVITLISGARLSKIMRVGAFNVSYEKEWVRNLTTTLSMTEKTYYDIPGVFNFSRKIGEDTMPVHNFNVTEFTIDIRYAFKDLYFAGFFYRFFLPTKHPVLSFRYTAGVVNMQGDYFNYHNLQLSLNQRLSSPIGHTDYWVRAGKIFGTAPYTACYITQGNLGILLDKFNYNLMNEFEFISDQYVSVWVEHHFDGFFLNKIPGINKLHLRELVFVKSLWGSFSQANANVLITPVELHAPSHIPYVEAGFGLENIGYLFRADFMWRVTYRDPAAPHNGWLKNWAVKFVLQPGF